MDLSPNQMFHGRYLLVELMGSGASAVVWKALDTKAGNLAVALKIYMSDPTLQSTYGLQVFQREFTTVFNMTHTNLLRPSGYDVNEGCPYLVMQFCENGSATSMVGRTDEKDLLHFIHDVASGLEYLHDHNIIHQDVKPDNVLVDDNCNFLLTDFGISKNESSKADAVGGTRAYMAPEVYNGGTSKQSDIWSLGATAVELVTGYPPFGETGGLAEVQGEKIQLPNNLQPQVKELLTSMLEEEPGKRPSASQIRRQIEHYEETGSWNKKTNRNMWFYIGTGILSLFICAGIFYWDYTRVKVRYYKDYTEIWGVPKGIGRVSSSAQKHRQYTYKFQYSKGRLFRVSTVNSHGKLDRITETELSDKYVDAEFFYNKDGQIDYMKSYNKSGRCLYKLDYDRNIRTAIIEQDDEFGTEKTLSLNTTDVYNRDDNHHSNISRYKMTYDEKGRLIKREYAGFQNIDVVDEDMVHGVLYTYDDKNHLIETSFIGVDGEIRGNKKGLAIKLREYDKDDNFTKITYFTSERTPSHDGNNVTIVEYEYDKYGNTLSELYYDIDNNPVVRTDQYVHGFRYEYDDNGHRIKSTNIGVDGKSLFSNSGYVSTISKYDDNGYESCNEYVDDNDQVVDISTPNANYAYQMWINDEHGNTLEYWILDKFEKNVENAAGVWRVLAEFDSIGNVIGKSFFDKDDKPTALWGHESSTKISYDKYNRLIEQAYFDDKGNPTVCSDGYHKVVIEYNMMSNPVKYQYLGADGKLIKTSDLYAQIALEYDELGNNISRKYLDENGNVTLGSSGYAMQKYKYDSKTNLCIAYYQYDAKGKQIQAQKMKYDKRGNVIELRDIDETGQLEPNSVVKHYEYNDINQVISEYYTDGNNNLSNAPGAKYSKIKTEYDSHGNRTKTTFWDKQGKPCGNKYGTHVIIKKYDDMDNLIYWKDLDVDGNPNALESNYPEVKYKYDNRGNQIEFAIFDGHDKAINGHDGWHKKLNTYSVHNQTLTTEYRTIDGKLVKSKEDEYARKVNTYDSRGNLVKIEEYDESTLIQIITQKLNSKEKVIEVSWKDANGNNRHNELSKIVIEYESDEVTPKKKSYYGDNDEILAYQVYDKDKGDWSDLEYSNTVRSQTPYYTYDDPDTDDWQSVWYELARKCPIEVEDGLMMQSISVSYSSISITFRFKSISKYELGSSANELLDEVRDNYMTSLREYIPSYVSLYINFQDKAGRSI